jgi:hypothetical protein
MVDLPELTNLMIDGQVSGKRGGETYGTRRLLLQLGLSRRDLADSAGGIMTRLSWLAPPA